MRPESSLSIETLTLEMTVIPMGAGRCRFELISEFGARHDGTLSHVRHSIYPGDDVYDGISAKDHVRNRRAG